MMEIFGIYTINGSTVNYSLNRFKKIITNIDFKKSILKNIDFNNALLENVDFSYSIFKDVNFDNAVLKNVNLKGVKFKSSTDPFKNCELINCTL